ncbi:HPr(Ser) kinase/phosphatase [Desulfurispirillum indicum]|uniref:HPr kinase/phosphorylase n=1 Tax=Desulfurispirillum indicum (strain ATCC BAA-1389 / DSM 22839 / S5) TaxID=653733 RepID=E6W1Z2_DESIS|nr:HPr(Ser) kinase/phosphatase [Desulfurispirillum indicum]ADU66618.1 HPr serine kinase domain-containing protein [Desulfurispirillum indicum S5]UCZ55936.1 HPr(Ser) kinase/phosphatase [Desulfurispirillum indicum]
MLTVADFYEHNRNILGLRILVAANFSATILQPRIQKSGLALTGYTEFVHEDRIQIFGQTEMGYLGSIGRAEATRKLESFLTFPFPAVLITHHPQPIEPWMLELFTRHGVALLQTVQTSSHVIATVTRYLEFELAEQTTLHGGMMDIFGVGMLITGESGIGKSECCLDLITSGHRLVADDVVLVKNISGELVAFSNNELEHHMEVRGLGIINIKDIFGAASVRRRKKVELIIELQSWERQNAAQLERLGDTRSFRHVLDIDIPVVCLPVTPGRNIAKILEVLARNTILQNMGYQTVETFMSKLHNRIQSKTADGSTGGA